MRLIRGVSTAVIWFGLISGLELSLPRPASAQILVNLQFRNESNQQLAVRAGAFSGTTPRPPVGLSSHLYQSVGSKSYFYCDGNAQVSVPAGSLTIRAGRGFEYQARDTTVVISGPTTIRLALKRIFDMKAAGWYSADTHVHITHQPQIYVLGGSQLLLAMQGEDLNYANSMEEQANFTGLIDPASQSDRIIQFTKEERNAHFSHLSILGMRQWIPDQSCAETNIACGRTLDKAIQVMINAQTGENAVIATHPFCTFNINDVSPWPGGGLWRGMSIDLPVGGVDAMDLLTYTNALPPASVVPYFHALNAGFRLPPSAGTDCTLANSTSMPLGGYRVYVSPTTAFNMDSWIAAFKAGRSFVSNYPLFTQFNVEGVTMGGVLETNASTLHGTVTVRSGKILDKVEIIGDTGVLAVIQPPAPMKTITGSFDVPRAGLTWIVARATGGGGGWHVVDASGLFAQTAPVYLEDNTLAFRTNGGPQATGEPRLSAVVYFLGQLSAVESLYNTNGNFPEGSRAAFDAAVAYARQYYYGLMEPTDVPTQTPAFGPAWQLKEVWPNPTGSSAHVIYRVPTAGAAHEVGIYDAAGRVVTRLFSGTRAEGDHQIDWDGRDARGISVASGVYFVRVQPRGAPAVARKLVLVH